MALRVAERWFSRREVGRGVTLLWEPHVAPLLRCNVWHVRGRARDLVVDTGLGVASLVDAARDLFERPLAAVATHVHHDHTGGMHEFAERWIHASEADAMASGENNLPLELAAYDDATRKFFANLGYDLSAGLITAIPREGFDPAAHRLAAATATRVLHEGDVIDLGDRAFEVLHLPGHSPGSIGLWDAKSGTLFSGDAIYDGPLLDQIPGANVPDYLATMRRLRELPVSVVHGGHDPSFGRARLVEIADDYLARRTA
ncbi:MAG: MBL fold metallo-hydrolase [Deltaproteobacteria bacterium]|nr:MBL fold metallo-hydrolase [Deltaproteobacteria bacterium]